MFTYKVTFQYNSSIYSSVCTTPHRSKSLSIPQFLQHLISPCCPPHQPASYFPKHLKKPVSLSLVLWICQAFIHPKTSSLRILSPWHPTHQPTSWLPKQLKMKIPVTLSLSLVLWICRTFIHPKMFSQSLPSPYHSTH